MIRDKLSKIPVIGRFFESKDKKTVQVVRSVKNWYADRYASMVLQRNFLFIFVIVSSCSVLVALIAVKSMYEQRAIDPYLIEVEKETGIITVVDYDTQKEYTAQEAIKESLIMKYIKLRESVGMIDQKDQANEVRVFSDQSTYEQSLTSMQNNIQIANKFGRDSVADIKIRNFSYLTPNRIQVRFSKIFKSPIKTEIMEKKYSLIMNFTFVDIKMNVSDRRLNPLGFQINSYILQEEISSVDE